MLGLELQIPLHVVESIEATHLEHRDRLLHVLIEFAKQLEPRPTWRVIIDALKSPTVNLSYLAGRVEAAHFSDLNAIREAVPEITEPTGNLAHIHTCSIHELHSSVIYCSSGLKKTVPWTSFLTKMIRLHKNGPPVTRLSFSGEPACKHHYPDGVARCLWIIV